MTNRQTKPTTGENCGHARRTAWGWWFFAAVALFFLLTEHRAHLFGVLPFLFLLACPLMHLFMHRGQGGHQRPMRKEDER